MGLLRVSARRNRLARLGAIADKFYLFAMGAYCIIARLKHSVINFMWCPTSGWKSDMAFN
ncbi:hypothetical protein SHDE107825_17375 [Shewanella denitrificans]|jgi:hypothetical protein